MIRIQTLVASALALVVAVSSVSFADEGMWLFENLPTQQLQSRYSFSPTAEWTDHVMKSAVRFPNGSGSFISSTGLVLTNHHVAADTLHKLGTPERDIFKNGYTAMSQAQELKAPDLELNQLISIEDVTAQVNAAVTAGMNEAQAAAARRAVISQIESASTAATGLKSNVITLYNGGRFHLYRYKRYTDVRLVWSPEYQIAFLGGDEANFEFPRFNLDATIFRVYENGQPARIQNFLKWSTSGARPGELAFVVGNPGTTLRLQTMSALESLRDLRTAFRQELGYRREVALGYYSLGDAERERKASGDLFGVKNSRKVFNGQLAALNDPSFMALKKRLETDLRSQVAARPDLQAAAGAWDTVAAGEALYPELFIPYTMYEGAAGFWARHFTIARQLVRLAAERQKPNAERLPEYQDAAIPALEQTLFSPATIYDDLEIVKLTDSLSHLVKEFGGNDTLVKTVLDGKGPAARAFEVIAGTRVKDVAYRRELAAGGQAAIDASVDPMIRLAKMVDSYARTLRARYETTIREPQTKAYSQIANAIFAINGTSAYPDATFTLRLSFGEVKGFMQDGAAVDPLATFGGMFQAIQSRPGVKDWELPQKWKDAASRIDLTVPFNFSTTNDIIGGNSGSPVINREGELIGLVFDGNRFSFEGAFLYRPELNRAVSVHSSGIIEALRKVYGAEALADEITARNQSVGERVRQFINEILP